MKKLLIVLAMGSSLSAAIHNNYDDEYVLVDSLTLSTSNINTFFKKFASQELVIFNKYDKDIIFKWSDDECYSIKGTAGNDKISGFLALSASTLLAKKCSNGISPRIILDKDTVYKLVGDVHGKLFITDGHDVILKDFPAQCASYYVVIDKKGKVS